MRYCRLPSACHRPAPGPKHRTGGRQRCPPHREESDTGMIRVLLAEDQTMVRGALVALLALAGDIEEGAEASRGDEVVPRALAAKPDAALLDIEMPGGDGLAAAAALNGQLPSCHVLMLTTFRRPGYLRRALESGAAGFLLKDAPP